MLAACAWISLPASGLALTIEEQNTIEVYRRASASVVHIRSVVVQYGFFFRPVPVEGTGSGVMVDDAGHIITNAHVIQNARSLEVTLSDGSQWPAKLIGSRPERDLAVIRIDAPRERIHPIPMGDSSILKVGQKVLAIGNPFGLQQTATQGVISSLNRSLTISRGVVLEGLIQTDAAINPGNSGGPLLNRDGHLIGINTVIISPSGGNVGVGFAIPVNQVKRELPRLRGGPGGGWIGWMWALLGIVILVWLWRSLAKKAPRWG